MEYILPELKRVSRTLLWIDGVFLLGALLAQRLEYTLFVGLGYGFVFCLLYFILLGSVVKNALERPPERAKRFLQVNYVVRYLLLGVILAVAFLSPHINAVCVCLSFLAPKITYTVQGFRDYLSERFGPAVRCFFSSPEREEHSMDKEEKEA